MLWRLHAGVAMGKEKKTRVSMSRARRAPVSVRTPLGWRNHYMAKPCGRVAQPQQQAAPPSLQSPRPPAPVSNHPPSLPTPSLFQECCRRGIPAVGPPPQAVNPWARSPYQSLRTPSNGLGLDGSGDWHLPGLYEAAGKSLGRAGRAWVCVTLGLRLGKKKAKGSVSPKCQHGRSRASRPQPEGGGRGGGEGDPPGGGRRNAAREGGRIRAATNGSKKKKKK